MSVILFAENSQGIFKKAVLEAATYAYQTAQLLGTQAMAVTIGEIANDQLQLLGKHGISKVLHIDKASSEFHAQTWSTLVSQAFNALQGSTLIISNTYCGKAIAPRVAVHLQASIASNVVALPTVEGGNFTVKRAVFSGKGFAFVALNGDKKIVAFMPNSIDTTVQETAITIETASFDVAESGTKVLEVNTVKGKVPLTEATLVVSAGRGLKGPENWNLVEDLADALGAATACSKPVSDMGWRPHAEHVGQTGITIKPNLYIAIGISGAIQHLAGVSSSKVIVAINKDPEAPFFKAADFGIVGDAFEILPRLTASLKSLSSNA